MNRSRLVLARNVLQIALVAFAFLALAPAAPAAQRGAYSMEILVDGVPLREHVARGTTYIEALRGREYSVRLRNHTGERVAVALSVDGLNSIDAKAGPAHQASKWILGPYATLTLDGWQTSSSTARRFFFTSEDDSYGAWLGETRNLGIVSAAVFRERRPRPAPVVRGDADLGRHAAPSDAKAGCSKREQSARENEAPDRLSDELAATGIGRELDHRVRRTRFDSESRPSAVLNVRYEYRDALVRLGVLSPPPTHCDDPLARRERARGFDDTDFAPDPFRR